MRQVFSRAARSAIVLLGLTAGASDVRADPLTFDGTYFLIDSSPTRLDLFSNPGVVLEARTYDGSFPPSFSFGTFVSYQGGESLTDTIRFTYREEGAEPVIISRPFTTGTQPIRLGFAELFAPIGRTGMPIPTTLTVELLSSSPDFVIPGGPSQGQRVDSYTYAFSTQSPVPEPSTLMLLASGGAVALRAVRRRRTPRPIHR